MKKIPVIWLIAGTSEGRRLIKDLAGVQVKILVSVATTYGADLIEAQANVTVQAARLDLAAMQEFLRTNKPDCVVDATHPYATIVTNTVRAACQSLGYDYLRLLRPASCVTDCIEVDSYQDAVEFLSHTKGNIFLTTGSKTLELFTAVPQFAERTTLRVLPMVSSLEKALSLGYQAGKIICMQGPFSEEVNVALFKSAKTKFVVTKDSGNAGGFEAKKRAAQASGAQLVVIRRLPGENGAGYEETLATLRQLCSAN
ncbi:MAG: precorrin-6A reductase [Acidaminococcaceae bacterium]